MVRRTVFGIIPFALLLLKVTILMGYSFQTSSKKEGVDPYNPEYNMVPRFYINRTTEFSPVNYLAKIVILW